MANITVDDKGEREHDNQSAPAPKSARPVKSFSVGVKVATFVVVLVLAALIAGLLLLFNDRKQLKEEVNKLTQTSQAAPVDDATLLTAEVGKLIELPDGEVPTVATVVDADKVKNQAFFTNAQNGDKVLLYSKSGKGILYRPSTKKIIEVAPINIGENQAQGTTTE